jgi:hypothetical protein
MVMPERLASVSADQLNLLYSVLEMSQNEIAHFYGVSQRCVCRLMKKRLVAARPKSLAQTAKRKHCPKVAKGYRRKIISGRHISSHRLVAEQTMGRPLTDSEVVHHDNKIKTDNRPENLWVFPNNSAHITYHKTGTIHPDTIFLKDYLG